MRISRKPRTAVTLIAAGSPLALHKAVDEIGQDLFRPLYLSAHRLDRRCAYAVKLINPSEYRPAMFRVFERHGCTVMAADGAWGERPTRAVVTAIARARGELRGEWQG